MNTTNTIDFQAFDKFRLLHVGGEVLRINPWLHENNSESISSIHFLDTVIGRFPPDLLIFDSLDEADVKKIRNHKRLFFVPVLVVQRSFETAKNLDELFQCPNVLLCNSVAAFSAEFAQNLLRLLQKQKRLLPVKTGMIVKSVILYLNKNISKKITRESLAQTVGVCEDYVSRVFRAEMGMSLWRYVHLYRMDAAHRLLLQTGLSVAEVARRSGFPDAAYFTRAFHEFYNLAPSAVRTGITQTTPFT